VRKNHGDFVLFFGFANMIIREQIEEGYTMTVDHAMHPGSIEELKAFVSQIEMILPEDKRTAILHTIAQIEASGGIQNEAQGQHLLTELMKGLGL